jgi:hypothetical protein
VSKQVWYGIRWLILGLLTGGILLQSACATSLATGSAGLLTSITNEFIRNLVNKSLGVETFGFSFGT